MDRIKFITFKDKKILVEDFTNLNPGSAFEAAIKKAQALISGEPKGSVLAVFDASGCSFNSDSINLMKKFTSANEPFIKKAAVVGMNGLLQVALSAVSKSTGREFVSFKTREEAMNYLAELE